jgi:hypothetical protein
MTKACHSITKEDHSMTKACHPMTNGYGVLASIKKCTIGGPPNADGVPFQ